MSISDKKWIVVFGNPIDGLRFHGPFVDASCARDYADDVRDHHGESEEYWLAQTDVLPHTAWAYGS